MNTLTPSPAGVEATSRETRRDARHAARRTLWDESSLKRIRACGNSLCKRTGDGSTVSVKMSKGVAGFSGLQSCGSVWSCPVCSLKIATRRADEVQAALKSWNKTGGRVAFVTLTMRHKRGQKLVDLWDALSYAWNKVTSGRGWKSDADLYGVMLPRLVKSGLRKGQVVTENRIHYVRAVEVTYGENGWHVHIHCLLFVKDEMTPAEVARLSGTIYSRWANALVAKGLTSPSPERGVDFRLVRRDNSDALAKYFTKSVYKSGRAAGPGWEIAGGTTKSARGGSRTPFQILEDVVTDGDAADLALWHAWEKGSHGKRQLTWSVGLRDLLELEDELTDEEIAEEDLGGEVVMTFTSVEWLTLRWYSSQVLRHVEAGCDYVQICKIYGLPPA